MRDQMKRSIGVRCLYNCFIRFFLGVYQPRLMGKARRLSVAVCAECGQ